MRAGEVKFTASSLEDVAQAIDMLGALAEKEQLSEKTRTKKNYRAGEAFAYYSVARMLRNTEIRS